MSVSIKEDISLIAVEEGNIEDDLWDYILLYMKQAEFYIKSGGKDKKKYVLKKIKGLLGDDAFERYEPFIQVSVDFIITLSRNKAILTSLNNKCCIGITKCFNNCLKKNIKG